MKKVTVYQALDGSTFNNERDCLDYENQFPGHRLVSVLKEIWDSLSNGGRGVFRPLYTPTVLSGTLETFPITQMTLTFNLTILRFS